MITVLPNKTERMIPIPIVPKKIVFFLTSLKKLLILSIHFSYNPRLIAIKLPLTPGTTFPKPITNPFITNFILSTKGITYFIVFYLLNFSIAISQ